MKFSVVVTVFNKAEFISDTLKSVLAQTHKDFELIVINDGSTDNSEEEILKLKDPRIRYFFQENKGAGAARNAGIEKANHDFIAFLDGDDYWHPFFLNEIKSSIKKFPKEFVFATAMEKQIGNRIFPEKYSIDFKTSPIVKVNYFEASNLFSALSSSSFVVHKEVFAKVGNYDSSIKSGQDTDLYVRIGLNYDIVFSKKICAKQIVREKNSLFRRSRNLKDKADFEAYEVYEKDNPKLKKFLDLNRYALALLAKMNNDIEGFQRNYKKIDLQNLSFKQRFLLKRSSFFLKRMMALKNSLEKKGWRIGTFKK